MILKASQRGGARNLADHLMKVEENEHVEIHEISGFVSDDLHGALREIHAISRGTKCKQFMFSVSLNPPETESVPVEYFEKILAAIEKKTKLEGQPRVIIFHEKEGRRHCHAVWSRIKTEEMKAVNLPHFKLKLRDISREIFFEMNWKMPPGLMNSQQRNPLNFTLAEWQQAKRIKDHPKALKAMFQECWAVSDSKAAFVQALKERGYILAQGDRRGFVAVDYRGEVFSLSRWTGIKPKDLKARLGEPDKLPALKDVTAEIAKQMTEKLHEHARRVKQNAQVARQPLLRKKERLVDRHRQERQALASLQKERWQQEMILRSQRIPKGFSGIWSRLTGKYWKIRSLNEKETVLCQQRDRHEKQTMIETQLRERQHLQKEFVSFREYHQQLMQQLKRDVAYYLAMGSEPPVRNAPEKNRSRDRGGHDLER